MFRTNYRGATRIREVHGEGAFSETKSVLAAGMVMELLGAALATACGLRGKRGLREHPRGLSSEQLGDWRGHLLRWGSRFGDD